MVAGIESVVEKEIGEFKSAYGRGWYRKYFNNFYCNLPGGPYRKYGVESQRFDYPGGSEMINKQTFGDFVRLVDSLIIEEGLSVEMILMYQNERQEDPKAINELYHYVLPLYVRLREMGYKRYPDLVA